MTETWAGMLRDVANRVCADHWHTELCECEIAVPQLRRLASLLEQITPETVTLLRRLSRYAGEAAPQQGTRVDDDASPYFQAAIDAMVLADRLRPLAATPSEETD